MSANVATNKKWYLELFKKASTKVPAYKKFLAKKNFNPRTVQTEAKFSEVPLMTKKNYIVRHKKNELIPHGDKLPDGVYASSGSSGKPTFWYMDEKRQQVGVDGHEHIMRDVFGISKKDKTLVIVCFSLGLWVAGSYTINSFRGLNQRGYNMTVAATSINLKDIWATLREISASYDKIIFAGYPAFIVDAFLFLKKQGYKFRRNDTFVLVGGDKVNEKWRSDVMEIIGIPNTISNRGRVISVYGCADAAFLGNETLSSIVIRQAALQDKDLYQSLFGEKVHINEPGLFQFDDRMTHIESVDGEIVLTANTAIPLIRYNIQDVGKVFSVQELRSVLEKHGYKKLLQSIKLDSENIKFVSVKGRNDVAATFYALNILPEHVQAVLRQPSLASRLSGNFAVYSKFLNKSKRERLYVDLELKSKARLTDSLQKKVEKDFLTGLKKVNIEYRKLHHAIGDKADPKVHLFRNGDSKFTKNIKKGLVYINGKKPRLII